MLVFSFKKFIDKKVHGQKIRMPEHITRIMKTWDGKPVHRFQKNNVRCSVFGETHYIFVGGEKIAIGEEFCEDLCKVQTQEAHKVA
jgi:hypothetical protein